jgi:hypothetical protein
MQDRETLKRKEHTQIAYRGLVSFLLINQMAKKTRKMRKSRRRTRRRRGGGIPLPNDAAIRVSTAGDSSDNLMGMKAH